MNEYVGELKLKEPLTKEDYEMITDVDFKYTNKVIFKTPHCGEVEFVKVIRCKDCKHNYGKKHNKRYNHEDIVCDYFETDGLNDNDFCSYGERSEDE